MKCPRCDADTVRVMTKSPVGDVWEVYVCDTCSYSWRSTEEIHDFDVQPGIQTGLSDFVDRFFTCTDSVTGPNAPASYTGCLRMPMRA